MQTTACVRVSLPAQEDENAAGRKRLNWVKFMELIKVVITSIAHVREGFIFSVGEVQTESPSMGRLSKYIINLFAVLPNEDSSLNCSLISQQ